MTPPLPLIVTLDAAELRVLEVAARRLSMSVDALAAVMLGSALHGCRELAAARIAGRPRATADVMGEIVQHAAHKLRAAEAAAKGERHA